MNKIERVSVPCACGCGEMAQVIKGNYVRQVAWGKKDFFIKKHWTSKVRDNKTNIL